jgi:CCR4-NOT transcription complex subunit 3
MANRKLLGEIDRVLKKVDEGVTVFEQIWDKVYSATTTAQKEKYEGDLKKEIKKLQRLRDQIKNWQGDSSIKDKSKLDANRKLIEEKMEKFKVCEKETKTKAFSKEGLAQDRTDPKQKAKAEVGDWVREAISRLREQSDEFEAEIEQHNSGAKRKKRGEELPRVAELKEHITRHGYHVEMLEKVLRAVDNDQVTPEQCDDDLRELVDY